MSQLEWIKIQGKFIAFIFIVLLFVCLFGIKEYFDAMQTHTRIQTQVDEQGYRIKALEE